MTFADRIAMASDPGEVFRLVNQFVEELRRSGKALQLGDLMRPSTVSSLDDLDPWLHLVSAEIAAQDARCGDPVDVLYALHAVLKAARKRFAQTAPRDLE